MIKTKNIVMLILSTILAINIMTISAFGVDTVDFEGVYSKYNADTLPLGYASTSASNWIKNHNGNLAEIIIYKFHSDNLNPDVYRVRHYIFDINEFDVFYENDNLKFVNKTSDYINFVHSDMSISYGNGKYPVYSGSPNAMYSSSIKSGGSFTYSVSGAEFIYSDFDIYDCDGNKVINSANGPKINFEVKVNSALDWFQVIASVEDGVTEFDDYYTWGIEATNETKLLYVHESFWSFTEKSGQIFKSKSKSHFLTYQTPMISTVLLETLYGGETPVLTFGTDYKISLMRYSIGADGGVEYYPLKDYSATINIQSFNDYEIEYSGNVEQDLLGNIYYNYNDYNGQFSNTDVDFDGAINDFENITKAEWSPNLMSGLTVVRGLFDDIIDSLGLVDIIMIILTLGLVGWFLGRKMRG